MLQQHPHVGITTPKEPHYFACDEYRAQSRGPGDDVFVKRFACGKEQYNALFESFDPGTLCGDASTGYLHYAAAVAPRVHSFNSGIKLIAILRNPIERAYSSYLYYRSRGRERLSSFEEALEAEPARRRAGWSPMWHYLDAGFYSQRLESFLGIFPRSQVFICLFDDLVNRRQEIARELFEFLGVHPIPVNRGGSVNISGEPRFTALHHLMFNALTRRAKGLVPGPLVEVVRKVQRGLLKPASPMEGQTRAWLARCYEEEVESLFRLLDRPLGHWLHLP
jgi:hypothetical protein